MGLTDSSIVSCRFSWTVDKMKGTHLHIHSRRRAAEKKLPTVLSYSVCGLYICIFISDDYKQLLVKAHTAVNRS